MKKRFAVFLTILLAALCLLPAPALAAEPEALSAPKARSAAWSSAEAARDSGGLFSVYVAARLYGVNSAEAATGAGSRLTGNDRALYDALRPRIKRAAERGGSTVFTFTAAELGLPTRWAARRLGGQITQEAVDGLLDRPEYQFDFKAVQNALLADCPYEQYWFKAVRDEDGPGGVIIELEPNGIRSEGGDIIIGLTCTFQFYVARGYRQDGDPFAVRTDVANLAAARGNIQAVLAENAGRSDYEKLTAYKDAVRGLADYSGKAGAEYGDPWQLIWALDGDPNTAATCEGYAKAFQYLCDMGGLEEAECYTVNGLMDGVPHMWNIVRTGSKNYLADVAASDAGGVGQDGGLFLAGARADYSTDPKGWTVALSGGTMVTYHYDEYYTDPWGKDVLLELAEEDYALAAGAVPGALPGGSPQGGA